MVTEEFTLVKKTHYKSLASYLGTRFRTIRHARTTIDAVILPKLQAQQAM